MTESPLSQFVADARLVRSSGRWKAANNQVLEFAQAVRLGDEWLAQTISGLFFNVFQEFLRIEEAYAANPVDASLVAWRARNLLELSIWSLFSENNRENARLLFEDALRDMDDLLLRFEQWGRESEQADFTTTPLIKGRKYLAEQAALLSIDRLEERHTSITKIAEASDLGSFYMLMNKLLSKFVHPTAMQIVGIADQEKQERQRDLFFELSCLFFVTAFASLENGLRLTANDASGS